MTYMFFFVSQRFRQHRRTCSGEEAKHLRAGISSPSPNPGKNWKNLNLSKLTLLFGIIKQGWRKIKERSAENHEKFVKDIWKYIENKKILEKFKQNSREIGKNWKKFEENLNQNLREINFGLLFSFKRNNKHKGVSINKVPYPISRKRKELEIRSKFQKIIYLIYLMFNIIATSFNTFFPSLKKLIQLHQKFHPTCALHFATAFTFSSLRKRRPWRNFCKFPIMPKSQELRSELYSGCGLISH